MSIFNLMTIATNSPNSRLHRLIRSLAVVAFVASWSASLANAAETHSTKLAATRLAARTNDALLAKSQHATITAKREVSPGQSLCNGIRPQDEIVVVNTRNICGCCASESLRNGIKVEKYAVCDEAGNRHWEASDLDSFLAFDPTVPTVIFVHGNQISPWDAKCEGLAVYRCVIRHADDAAPIRYVIFSWPSTKISGGLLNDIRVKAARTGPAGCQLAWLIDQMPAETPLSLVGFSFGGRIITGSLHVLAGGSLGGSMCLGEHVHPNRSPVSVILMASAGHAHWLGDGRYHGLAMTQVSRMFLVNNCDDPAMKYYDYIEPGFGGPQALGLCGPTCISAENARKIMMRDMSCSVGAEHNLFRYLYAPGDAGLIWEYTAGSAVVEVKTGG